MEYYNQSLRFAEKNSVNISFAYSNRSACFFYMGKYNECLKDIALAKKNNYPRIKIQKLNEREILCLEQLKEKPENHEDIVPKLDFESNKKFPCMANVIEIRYNEEFGTTHCSH